jgi:hypothetical protein
MLENQECLKCAQIPNWLCVLVVQGAPEFYVQCVAKDLN